MSLKQNVTPARILHGSLSLIVVGLVIAVVATPATGHGIFKKTLEKKYKEEGLRVTCNMCHVKGEEKTQRNDFGQVFFKEFEGMDLSSKWDAVEGDERKKLEAEVMAPAFLEALENIYTREKEGKAETNYSEEIPAGKIEGSKLKKKK